MAACDSDRPARQIVRVPPGQRQCVGRASSPRSSGSAKRTDPPRPETAGPQRRTRPLLRRRRPPPRRRAATPAAVRDALRRHRPQDRAEKTAMAASAPPDSSATTTSCCSTSAPAPRCGSRPLRGRRSPSSPATSPSSTNCATTTPSASCCSAGPVAGNYRHPRRLAHRGRAAPGRRRLAVPLLHRAYAASGQVLDDMAVEAPLKQAMLPRRRPPGPGGPRPQVPRHRLAADLRPDRHRHPRHDVETPTPTTVEAYQQAGGKVITA